LTKRKRNRFLEKNIFPVPRARARAKIIAATFGAGWNFRKRRPPSPFPLISPPHRPDRAVEPTRLDCVTAMTLIAHREPIDKSFRALDRRSPDTQYGRIEALIRSQLDPADRLSDSNASKP